MAVTFDAHFEKGQASATTPFSYVSSAGTITGSVGVNSNRVLIAYVAFQEDTNIPSAVAITWNGVSMTQIGTQIALIGASHAYRVDLFGLIAPATGANTISASWSGGGMAVCVLGAVSVYNADQTTGWNNNTSATGTSTAAAVTITTVDGGMAIATELDDNASGGPSINVGTSDWIETAFTGNYAMARNPASGTSTTVSWTLGSSVAWEVQGVHVLQFSASGATQATTPTPYIGLWSKDGVLAVGTFDVGIPINFGLFDDGYVAQFSGTVYAANVNGVRSVPTCVFDRDADVIGMLGVF